MPTQSTGPIRSRRHLERVVETIERLATTDRHRDAVAFARSRPAAVLARPETQRQLIAMADGLVHAANLDNLGRI